MLRSDLCFYYCLILLFLSVSCNKDSKQQDIKSYLTSDSVQFWDAYNFNKSVKMSYSFDKFGRCEFYGLGIDGIRRVYPYDSIPNEYGICNRWELNDDGTLNIMCEDKYEIILLDKDSMVLKKLNNPGSQWVRAFYKVKNNLNIDKERLLWRDSILQIRQKERKEYEDKIKKGEIEKSITIEADD